METLECHVKLTVSPRPKNITSNLKEISWELDAIFPNILPAQSLCWTCYPPTLLLITSPKDLLAQWLPGIFTNIFQGSEDLAGI